MAATSLISALAWIYAVHNHRLVRKDLSSKYIKYSILYNLAIPAFFLLSIPLSFYSLDFATYSWILIIVGPLLVLKLNPVLRKIERE